MAAQFVAFAKFPGEIQSMIWSCSVADVEPQVIVIKSKHRYRLQDPTATSKRPAALYVCRESRRVARLVYTLAFNKQLTSPVYVNFAQDTIGFSGFYAFRHILESHKGSKEFDNVLSAVVYFIPDRNFWECDSFYSLMARSLATHHFKNVRNLKIVLKGDLEVARVNIDFLNNEWELVTKTHEDRVKSKLGKLMGPPAGQELVNITFARE